MAEDFGLIEIFKIAMACVFILLLILVSGIGLVKDMMNDLEEARDKELGIKEYVEPETTRFTITQNEYEIKWKETNDEAYSADI